MTFKKYILLAGLHYSFDIRSQARWRRRVDRIYRDIHVPAFVKGNTPDSQFNVLRVRLLSESHQ